MASVEKETILLNGNIFSPMTNVPYFQTYTCYKQYMLCNSLLDENGDLVSIICIR